MFIHVLMDLRLIFRRQNKDLYPIVQALVEMRQKESGRRMFLVAAIAAAGTPFGVAANQPLSNGGLTFKDFGTADNGASYTRGTQNIGGEASSNQTLSKVVAIDRDASAVRVRFDPIRVEMTLPMGWQATEDWERGVAFSLDKRYRVVVWRVDFAFEGVKDAEHYAATKAGSIKARRPGVQSQARKLPDGTMIVSYENVPKGPNDSGPRTVFDLVIPDPKNSKLGVLLTLGMPASDAGRGPGLLGLLRQNMIIDW
jgi:hypothetical protein